MAENGRPALAPYFTIDVDLELPITVTRDKDRVSQFIPIVGGTVKGPRLSGRVLPYGGDWAAEHSDGSMSIHARYFIEADDGTRIGVDNAGVWWERPDAEPYFVTTPVFSAGDGPYADLQRSAFVGMGCEVSPTQVSIEVYEIRPA
jgi:hypothetical protein